MVQVEQNFSTKPFFSVPNHFTDHVRRTREGIVFSFSVRMSTGGLSFSELDGREVSGLLSWTWKEEGGGPSFTNPELDGAPSNGRGSGLTVPGDHDKGTVQYHGIGPFLPPPPAGGTGTGSVVDMS